MPAELTTTGRAVFLSYAREDAPAARRMADALRSAGLEVWFDESKSCEALPADPKNNAPLY